MQDKYQSFENLDVWKLSLELSTEIYAITNRENFSKDFGLKDQIRRASVSVMSNIAEGYERNNPKYFAHFLKIAKGSCGELRSQLYIAKNINYINDNEFEQLINKAIIVSKMLSNFIKSIESKS